MVTIRRGPDGERVGKTVARPGTAPVTTLYLGPDVEVAPDGVWTKRVTADVKRVGLGVSAQPHALHRDHLATVRLVTGATGQENQRTTYRPSSEVMARSGDLREELGFTGERHDREMGGLVDLHARTYDPSTSRFLQGDVLDPWLPGVGLHRYAYSLNDPVNKSDRNGNIVPAVVAAAVAVWGAVEFGLGVYDVVDAARTVADPNASLAEKGIAVGGALAGAALPGGGYGVAGKGGVNAVEEATEKAAKTAASTNRHGRTAGEQARENSTQGRRREQESYKESVEKYGADRVLTQRDIVNAEGQRMKDPVTGIGRRLDQVVIDEVDRSKASQVKEVTSLDARKSQQLAKEDRIRESGGDFVKGKDGGLVDIKDTPTELDRRE